MITKVKAIPSSDLMTTVIQIYQRSGSFEQTAAETGLSTVKVRKLLITAGRWQSVFSERVGGLRAAGWPVAAIATELQVSAKLVTAYLPYEKGIYKRPDRTRTAARSDHYRQRNNIAAARVVHRQSRQAPDEPVVHEQQISKGDRTMSEKPSFRAQTRQNQPSLGQPIRLHLELIDDYLSEADIRILKTYGESEDGTSISRDILVPDDMPLHALHYAIQRLFGWQNSHLRDFALPKDIYSVLTGDTVRGWFQLVGILYQYSTVEDDQFWDEDYASGSIKTWLRRKYTGPYIYRGAGEHYAVAQQAVRAFMEHFPVLQVQAGFDSPESRAANDRLSEHDPYVPVILRKAQLDDMTLEELNNSIIIETGQERLLERLLIRDILVPLGQRSSSRAELVAGIQAGSAAGATAAGELPYGRAVTRSAPDPQIKPVTDRLHYNYDYGDGWCVTVIRLDDCTDLLASGRLTADELAAAEQQVNSKHKPVCIARNGVNVMDDVGGLSGFIDFLRTIHEGEDVAERRSTLDWARSLGWNTRRVTMQNVL